MSRISSTIFQNVSMATFAHSFNEDSSFVETATPEMPCGKVPVLLYHMASLGFQFSEVRNSNGSVQGF